jgi:hypothetical protein
LIRFKVDSATAARVKILQQLTGTTFVPMIADVLEDARDLSLGVGDEGFVLDSNGSQSECLERRLH